MLEKERQIRNDKLNKIINELAESQGIFSDKKKYNDYYTKLMAVYKNPGSANFVHSHNEIFSVLAELDSENKSLEILGQNVRLMYEYCNSKKDTDILESVFQLYDHINLDIARLNYIKAVDRRFESTGQNLMSEIKEMKKVADDVREDTEGLKSTVDDMSGKVNNAYSEFVSILGIFSAIVLVFFGGTSIFGNIISNMEKTYIYKSIIMCVLTGAVVFNIIFMLIYFMAKILNRSIAATNDSVFGISIAVRFRERYPVVFYTNYFSFWVIYICSAVFMWNGIRNNYRYDIVKLIKDITNAGDYRGMIIFTLLYILFVFNLGFFLAYIISKVTDLNIGRMINVKYGDFYSLFFEEDQYHLLTNYDMDSEKIFKNKFKAMVVTMFLQMKSNVKTAIYNLFKRIFCRYPYYIWGNIAIVLSILFVINYQSII